MSGTVLRILTAAILLPLVVVAVWWGPLYLLTIVAGVIVAVALWEFFDIARHMGIHGYCYWTGLTAIAIFVQQWNAARAEFSPFFGPLYEVYTSSVSLEFVLLVFLFGIAVIALMGHRPVSEIFTAVSVSVAGLLFVVLPFSAVIRLAGVGIIGRRLLLFTLTVVWVGDTVAYFVGRAFGRRKLSPQWSPNKTWEGAAANLIGALLVAVAFVHWIKIIPLAHLLSMAALGSIAGQLGDIFESALKRSAGVKDSGSILPGHGGMYDRIDALIFAAPAVWYYFEWVARTVKAVSGSF